MELKDQLLALQGELKKYVEKADAEKKEFGTLQGETKSAIEKLQQQLDGIDAKLAVKHGGDGTEEKSLVETLKENDSVARLLKDGGRGRASVTLKSKDLQRKTTITSAAVGAMTTGVLTIDRIPGLTVEARQALRLRDLLVARPTTMQLVDFIRVQTPLTPAAPAPETTLKQENAVTFSAQSEKVRTIATFLPATRQIMEDFTELAGFLQDSLPYYVDLEEELQMLAGDGTGENLHGFIAQAQAYNTGLNGVKDNKIDTIGHAISQIATSKELAPTFIALNEADWWTMRLTKDGYGRYLLGDPQANVAPYLFNIPVVPTTNMVANTFLVGSGAAPAAEVRDRMETVVEISTEHADFFQRNMVAIRAEKRTVLVVKRPNAYITGSFPTGS